MSHSGSSGLVLACGLLTACASLPQPANMSVAPPAAAPAGNNWWRLYGDVALNDLIAQGLSDNPDIHAAEARTEALRAAIREAKAASAASLSLAFTANDARLAQASGLSTDPLQSSTRQALAQLDWSPDLWGRGRAGQHAAYSDAQAARADADDARRRLALSIVEGWIELGRLAACRELMREILAARRSALDIAQHRAAVGAEPASSIWPLEAQVETIAGQADRMDRSLATASDALAVAVGRSPGSQPLAPPHLDHLLLTSPRTDAGEASSLRPDVIAAAARIRASKARVDQARAAFYPSLNLMGFVGLLRLDGQGFRGGGGEAAIDIPLLDAGRRRAALSARQAERTVAEAEYRGVLLNAQGEVAQAMNDLHAALADGKHKTGVVAANAGTLDWAVERHRVGVSNELEALEAKVVWLESRIEAINLQAEALLAHAALSAATATMGEPGPRSPTYIP
ncbi:MAG: efflux transporter outer membrane subunit [Pseudochelatococcus sp.]|jgi:NodT family efflux transporter outer membrane factor (OMF) lipoprotein|uniref:efflux transporter outer membrane subunit n=1 Tax=Pseudochelatococcus sp. TaxID=2020869 RepID=UPI003D9229E7